MMPRLRVAIAVLALAVSVVAPAAADHWEEEGAISGSVTNGDGQPLEQICVGAFQHDDWGHWQQGWGTTNGEGKYTIFGLYDGEYLVRFHDCSEAPVYAPQWYDGAPTPATATAVSVTGGTETAGIDAVLAVGGSIAGTVVDESTGDPIESICVAARGEDDLWMSTWTRADGSYTLGGLTTGSYRVLFSGMCSATVMPPSAGSIEPRSSVPSLPASRYVEEWYNDKEFYEDADLVPVVQGTETPGVDAALVVGGSIIGLVTDTSGRPISDVCVDAYDAATREWKSSGYSWDGEYVIGGLRASTYKVQFYDCYEGRYAPTWYDAKRTFRDANPVEVALGQETGFIDAVLELRPVPDLAVTELTVENVPLRTDAAVLPSPGYMRRVSFAFTNQGDAPSYDSWAQVWVAMRDGSVRVLGQRYFGPLMPGETIRGTYEWNGFGSIGDATVYASVCTFEDRSRRNNHANVEHYVVVGGTGLGTQVTRGQPWVISPCPEDDWDF